MQETRNKFLITRTTYLTTKIIATTEVWGADRDEVIEKIEKMKKDDYMLCFKDANQQEIKAELNYDIKEIE
jgi:hypothetical protein